MFRIQYVNNLHLECYTKAVFPLLIKPQARYLALTGNIGLPGRPVFESFLDYVNDHWDKTFYIAGEKEYTHKPTILESHLALEDSLKKRQNIHYFYPNNSLYVTKENIAIVGSTLIKGDTDYNQKVFDLWTTHMNYRKYLVKGGGQICVATNDKGLLADSLKSLPIHGIIDGKGYLEFPIQKVEENEVDAELAKSAVLDIKYLSSHCNG
jgi:hypothetical protein